MPYLCAKYVPVINEAFLAVEKKWPNDRDRLTRMSLIQEGFPQYIRFVLNKCAGVPCLHTLFLLVWPSWLSLGPIRLMAWPNYTPSL